MAGGFSYPLSQLNRVTQSRRQPGSSFKPMTYLAALNHGLQPNTLVRTRRSPIRRSAAPTATRAPRTSGRRATMTAAIRHDDDAPRARAFQEPGDRAPARRRHRRRRRRKASTRSASWRWRRRSIRNACATIRSCSAPSRCGRSTSPRSTPRSPTRARRPTPHVIEQIAQDGRVVYKANEKLKPLRGGRSRRRRSSSARILQGVVARGTAARLCALSAVHRRQDRHQRRVQRRLVRRLQQRRHHRGLGRLRQRQGQAHARPRPGRLEGGDADLRADHAGGLGRIRAADAAAGPSPEAARRLVALPIDVQSGQRRRQPRRRTPSWSISGWTKAAGSTETAVPAGRARLRNHMASSATIGSVGTSDGSSDYDGSSLLRAAVPAELRGGSRSSARERAACSQRRQPQPGSRRPCCDAAARQQRPPRDAGAELSRRHRAVRAPPRTVSAADGFFSRPSTAL